MSISHLALVFIVLSPDSTLARDPDRESGSFDVLELGKRPARPSKSSVLARRVETSDDVEGEREEEVDMGARPLPPRLALSADAGAEDDVVATSSPRNGSDRLSGGEVVEELEAVLSSGDHVVSSTAGVGPERWPPPSNAFRYHWRDVSVDENSVGDLRSRSTRSPARQM
jgi:hypothetical protein